ncbi:MAG TPA: hypothetical protein VGB17_02795 [Pyrinomonadaceae bacterium]
MIGLCLFEASAQRRRSRRSRRISNPVINTAPATTTETPPASATEPQIVSTAEDQTSEQSEDQNAARAQRTNRSRGSGAPASEQESMRRTVNRLSSQVNRLTDKISQMEEQQRTLVNLERLTRAEQRAENLHAQLRDVQTKQGELQARSDQLDYEVKPENIERSTSVYGSTRPEELREQRRRQLEIERNKVRTLLDQVTADRSRLEVAVANADAEVERLRRLLETDNTQTNATQNNTNNGSTAQPAATEPATTSPPQPNSAPSSSPLP